MPVTEAQIETEVIARDGPLLTSAGLDGTTVNGSNPSILPAVGWALRQMGYAPAAFGVVTSTDLARVPDNQADELIDLAEYRVLLNIQGRLSTTKISLGPLTEEFNGIGDLVKLKLTNLLLQLRALYGFGLGSIGVGVIDWNIAGRTTADDENG